MEHAHMVFNQFLGDGLGSLFHHPDFFRLHAPGGGLYAEACDNKGEVTACIHFSLMDSGLWRSPARGTFAGYAFLAMPALSDWIAMHAEVEDRLVALGARSVEILLAPFAHAPAAGAGQAWMLASMGYLAHHWDLNQSLRVDEREFSSRISRGNAKRLRKCQREGLHARRVAIDELPAIHDLLAANRVANGHVLSMDLDQLRAMSVTFPLDMLLFGVDDGRQLVAAAVCLRISEYVMYVLYWGDRPGFESYSPVVQLADAIYGYCRQQGVSLLDLGTSTVGPQANDGLMHFKRGLACEESLKLRFSNFWESTMRDLHDYQLQYRELPFEPIQAAIRRKFVLERISRYLPRSILEVGCGLHPIFTDLPGVECTVVEPVDAFATQAAELAGGRLNVSVFHGTLEDFDPKNRAYDMVLVCSLLHEVEDPVSLLHHARNCCGPQTVVHLIVPNALSIHRLLAVAMGLIPAPGAVSATQSRMQQHSTFDMVGLLDTVALGGFDAVDQGSFFIKPFTHQQMQELYDSGFLSDRMLDGLEGLARFFPANGSELFVDARRRL